MAVPFEQLLEQALAEAGRKSSPGGRLAPTVENVMGNLPMLVPPRGQELFTPVENVGGETLEPTMSKQDRQRAFSVFAKQLREEFQRGTRTMESARRALEQKALADGLFYDGNQIDKMMAAFTYVPRKAQTFDTGFRPSPTAVDIEQARQGASAAAQSSEERFRNLVGTINARGGGSRFDSNLGVSLGSATPEEYRSLMELRGFGKTLFDPFGQLSSKFSPGARGPATLPFTTRMVGLEGGVLPSAGAGSFHRKRLFPEMGSLRFRSAQARARMSPADKAFYEGALRLQGLGPSSLKDFYEQEEKATGIKAPAFNRLQMMPNRIRLGG
jgi:hypothetical protein